MTTQTQTPIEKDRPLQLNGNAPAAVSPVREEPPAQPPSARSRSNVLFLLGSALVIGVGIVWGVRAWRFGAIHVTTDDAYLTSDTVPITPQVAGNVARVLVKDNQRVRAGEPLVILDDATFRADVDQAQANLGVAEAAAEGAATSVGLTSETGNAQIEQASGGVSQAESAVSVAESVDGADFVNINARTFLRDITHESRKDVGERHEYR